MTAATQTVMFDVEDFKVYPLLSDTGASPVYGPGVDVPGISEVSVEPNLISAELKGDGGRILAKKGKIDRFKMKATYGLLDLDVLAVVMGGAVDTATTDVSKYRAVSGRQLPYFKATFQIVDVESGLGEVVVELYKSQMTGGKLLGQKTDDFGQPEMEIEGIGLNCTDGAWKHAMMDIETGVVARVL